MSNYDKDVYADGRLVVGAERINGTGQVVLTEVTDGEPAVNLTLSNEEAVELGTAILQKAASARARQIHEEAGIEELRSECEKAERLQQHADDLRRAALAERDRRAVQ